MSLAWETTEEDIAIVLKNHKNNESSESVFEQFFRDNQKNLARIEESILYYDDMEDQTSAALSEIENILLENNVISGKKLF